MEKIDSKNFIGKEVNIVIDRALGTKHPKHGFVYTVNYGYVPNVISGDGEELDAYLLGVFDPVENYKGKCIAVIHRTNDDDDKMLSKLWHILVKKICHNFIVPNFHI